jgi:hypothetical protein
LSYAEVCVGDNDPEHIKSKFRDMSRADGEKVKEALLEYVAEKRQEERE